MEYNRPERIGYTVVPCLEFLNGEPWGDRILDYIHALRPSDVRIVQHNGIMNCDAVPWRVSVLLDEHNNVKRIEQEVEVGLRTADNGHCLDHKSPLGSWPNEGGIAIVNVRALRKGMAQ